MARYRLTLLAGAAGAVLSVASTASAQATGPATEIDEIIITAQLREQRALEVPFALTAYSGERLGALGVQELGQLSAFTPGFLGRINHPTTQAL